ncbi:phosphatidate cytidylyltransferase [Thermocrispum municipale]|uniref:phosphatidate cytidylyltransferase n=1 Tax=Thermocrispum municipale TaxID=37926 RepID=UPI001FE207BD|nr:phosphatidate cytidylyltransferase [Thermocrispum municipale]
MNDSAQESAGRKPSRAGRNLPAAIGVGVLLGAAILASLLIERHWFIAIVSIAMLIGSWEFSQALRAAAGIRVQLIPVLVGGQAIVWLSWPFGVVGIVVPLVLTVLLCLLWRLPGGTDGYLRDVAASALAVVYLPLCGAFAVLLLLPEDGANRVIAFMLGVVASDVGGYAAGVLKGKHPMAPSISPKKSWEGFAGSLIAGVGVGMLSVHFLLDGQVWQGALFGAAIVLTATLGDLVESSIKRDLGIKDMGTLLPGHGGLMDRLDSMLPSAVVAWGMLALFLPA